MNPGWKDINGWVIEVGHYIVYTTKSENTLRFAKVLKINQDPAANDKLTIIAVDTNGKLQRKSQLWNVWDNILIVHPNQLPFETQKLLDDYILK